MTCTKTGAHIYVEEYHQYCLCDAYEYNGIAVFNIVEQDYKPVRGSVVHYNVHRIMHDVKCDGDVIKRVIITKNFTYHGYEGIKIE